MHDDTELRLAVPASPEFLRLARLTAAGVASRMGFAYDEIEDLRIAIDELCTSLVGAGGRSGSIELRYWVDADGIAVEGVAELGDAPGFEPELSPLSRQILSAVVDEHGVAISPRGPTFRLLKRHATG